MSTPGRFRLLAAIIEFFLNAGRGCGIIIPTHRDYPRRPAFVPYPAPAGYAFALILFFGRGRGRGGRATAKPTGSRRSSADGFAVKMKRTKAGGRIVKSCSPFSAAKWQRQKSRQSRGQSGDFLRSKKYYSALDGLDSRNGYITGIVCGGEMCYTWVNCVGGILCLNIDMALN